LVSYNMTNAYSRALGFEIRNKSLRMVLFIGHRDLRV
jgi:hypothetical protein